MKLKEPVTAEVRAARRARYLTGLMWHVGTFLIINAFFWLLDAWGGSGVTWSFVVTVAWGLALAFHALAYLIAGRNVEHRKIEQYLEEDRRRHRPMA